MKPLIDFCKEPFVDVFSASVFINATLPLFATDIDFKQIVQNGLVSFLSHFTHVSNGSSNHTKFFSLWVFLLGELGP